MRESDRFACDVVDVHTHIGSLPGHVRYRFSAADLVTCLDNGGVRFALASSASSTTVGQSFGTREILDAAERYPDRIGALVWVNPYDPSWERDAEEAADRGAAGIKIHPALDTYRVGEDSLRDVFAFAQRRGLPICTHAQTGDYDALSYVPLVERFPDIDLVLFHFNSGQPLRGIVMAKRYPRVYLDTCFVEREAVEVALDVVGPTKILFGTDAPIFFDVGRPMPFESERPRTYHDCARDVEELAKSPADRDLILAGNARRIFKLPA